MGLFKFCQFVGSQLVNIVVVCRGSFLVSAGDMGDFGYDSFVGIRILSWQIREYLSINPIAFFLQCGLCGYEYYSPVKIFTDKRITEEDAEFYYIEARSPSSCA